MNFLIFRDFSGFFKMNFAIFNVKNDFKISKKGGVYSRGATWMRRGTQGHVAAPRGPTRVPTWRGCDVFIFIIIIRVIVHISSS